MSKLRAIAAMLQGIAPQCIENSQNYSSSPQIPARSRAAWSSPTISIHSSLYT
ncbi:MULTISPECIES: hypothetical protein [unclassified Microcoleus]|uniref:hypothetical protein n=1 Tax=unclassified Microcoleus TaxID=2642155 RepID=UPI002FD09BF6